MWSHEKEVNNKTKNLHYLTFMLTSFQDDLYSGDMEDCSFKSSFIEFEDGDAISASVFILSAILAHFSSQSCGYSKSRTTFSKHHFKFLTLILIVQLKGVILFTVLIYKFDLINTKKL